MTTWAGQPALQPTGLRGCLGGPGLGGAEGELHRAPGQRHTALLAAPALMHFPAWQRQLLRQLLRQTRHTTGVLVGHLLACPAMQAGLAARTHRLSWIGSTCVYRARYSLQKCHIHSAGMLSSSLFPEGVVHYCLLISQVQRRGSRLCRWPEALLL